MGDDELLEELGEVLPQPCAGPSDERVDALRARVAEHFGARDGEPRDDAAASAGSPPADVVPLRRAPATPVWTGVAAAAALVVGAGLATVLGLGAVDRPAPGPVEYDGELLATSGESIGELEVVEAGIGRVVRLRTDALPILPTGELYEVWFVGPDDTTDDPQRISAGTFHPDADGDSVVRFAAAVDPALYPTLEVTAEPGDGDPAATGAVVARVPLGTATG